MIKVRKELKLKSTGTKAIERHPVPVLGIDYRMKIVYKNPNKFHARMCLAQPRHERVRENDENYSHSSRNIRPVKSFIHGGNTPLKPLQQLYNRCHAIVNSLYLICNKECDKI